MENVPGLTHGKAAWHYNDLQRAFWDASYSVAAWVIEASRFGVAQKRKRLIVLGLRDDVVDHDRGITAAACRPMPHTHVSTVAEALAAMPEPDDHEVADREHASIIDKSIYESWKLLGEGYRLGNRNFNMSRPLLDEPCPTVTDTSGDIGAAGVCHPTEPRKFTPREIAALSCTAARTPCTAPTHPDRPLRTGVGSVRGSRAHRNAPAARSTSSYTASASVGSVGANSTATAAVNLATRGQSCSSARPVTPMRCVLAASCTGPSA